MKLSYAIVISLLGHGIVLMSWPDVVNFAVASTPPSYQVTLLEQQSEKIPGEKNNNTHSKTKRMGEHQKPTPLQKKLTKPAKKKQIAETKDHQNSATKAYVISRIHYEIKNHFRYPMLARRNGWQGKVILGLSVNSQGSIKNAHIKVSSGYRILDNSALKALIKVKKIHNIENWNYLNQHEFVIPVIYRLQKG